MSHPGPDILEAARLSTLCRGVCLYAGLPLPPATAPGQRFVVRSGAEPPELLAKLMEEGFIDDGIDVCNGDPQTECDPASSRVRVFVLRGFGGACPAVEELLRAVDSAGPALLFAVERRDEAGRLLGVTWAAVPEEEPSPQGRYRAAVRSFESDTPDTPPAEG